MKKLIVFFAVFILAACSGKPKGILNSQEIQPVILDLIKVDELVNDEMAKDSSLNSHTRRTTLYQVVFELHKTNREQFYTSLKYYEANPGKLKTIFDSMQAQVLRKRSADKPSIKAINTQ